MTLQAHGKVDRQFGSGLKLLGVAQFVIERKPTDPSTHISVQYDLVVPDGTQAINVEAICLDMAFGERDNCYPRQFADIWYEIRPDLGEDGRLKVTKLDDEFHCKFDFEAGLQDSPTAGHTAAWSARFVLQVKVFGV
jgi:hypothetical protein